MGGCDELQPSPATCKGSATPGLQVPRPTHLDGHGLAPDVQIARREKHTNSRHDGFAFERHPNGEKPARKLRHPVAPSP